MRLLAGAMLSCWLVGAEAEEPEFQLRLDHEANCQTPDGQPAREFGADTVQTALPAAALGPTGTLACWIRLPEELRGVNQTITLVQSEAVTLRLLARPNLVRCQLSFGPAMHAPGLRRPPAIDGLLTHLRAGRWYHLAFTWDNDDTLNRFILDGLDQGTPEPRPQPGALPGPAAGTADLPVTIGAPGCAVSGLSLWRRRVEPEAFATALRAAGHPRYHDEGINYVDERLDLAALPGKRLVYQCDFNDPADLADWVREGGESATIVDGRLRLRTGDSPAAGQHIVYWLKQEIPADFCAEWRFRPYDKLSGLTIVFFNARAVDGRSVLDPTLPPRDGTFQQYITGGLNSYHISYFAGHRGSVNLRKNDQFRLAAMGVDLIHTTPADEFVTVSLLKQGGRVRLAVDGQVALAYDDDGTTYGPVHGHSGWFALRQMFQSWYTDYDDLRIWALDD